MKIKMENKIEEELSPPFCELDKDAILVVCDRLSKMTHFVATTEGTTAEGLARLFWDNVWKLHGLPESIVSDRGPQFVVELLLSVSQH